MHIPKPAGAANPYPIDYRRLDNALEAMTTPSVDALSGLITGKMLDRSGAVDIHNTIEAPDGTTTEMFYQMRKTFNGIEITGQAGGQPIREVVDNSGMGLRMQGRIGESEERLDIAPTPGGYVYQGQIGDVPVRQQLGINPWTLGFQLMGQFGPVALSIVGQPRQDGTSVGLTGELAGKPLTGSIEGGQVANSMLVTREVDGYHWIQEIREQVPETPPAPPEGMKLA